MALRHLSLRDFVIVPALELDLHSGFSVLTGETGAGKSILIDALQLVLGARGEAIWVRDGQPRCEIAAEFDLPPDAQPWLDEAGFDHTSGALLLRRAIDANGRSRAWINGTPATLTQLRELADWLVDIHGQHAWQSLTRPAAIRVLLDAEAGVDLQPLAAAWAEWRSAEDALARARAAQDSSARERDRLLWQIGELDRLAPADGEWNELNEQHARLSHAQALIEAAQSAVSVLEAADRDNGVLSALARAQHALDEQRAIEPQFAPLVEILEACAAQAQDVAHSLHAYLRRVDTDPAQLQSLDDRLGQWTSLARRYRRPPAELPALLLGWRQELAALETAADLDQLQRNADALQQQFLRAAQKVSAQRAAAAPRLASAVTAAMQDLGMKGGQFEVQLTALAEPASHGLESVSFLVAAHVGSTPRAIEKVASGGELSRLALAIAVTTSRSGSVGTLVFDEVDSGVGGAVASTVGRLLHQLGRDRQVLCVTHLPQVAAGADHHLQVLKRVAPSGQTFSAVQAIDGDERTLEIARMLGGEHVSETTLAHAREMTQAALTNAGTPAKPARPSGRKARA